MNNGQFTNQQPFRGNAGGMSNQQPTPQYLYSAQNTPNTGYGNNVQPYTNNIQQPQPQMQGLNIPMSQIQLPSVVFIKDAQEIDEYLVPYGSGIIFIKEDWTELYQKSLDIFGKPETKSYSLVENKPITIVQQENNYVTWDELNKILSNLSQQKQTLGRKKVETDDE